MDAERRRREDTRVPIWDSGQAPSVTKSECSTAEGVAKGQEGAGPPGRVRDQGFAWFN